MRIARPKEFYQAMPKVDLHRHLEGSLRVSTLVEVGNQHGMDILGTSDLRPLVQIGAGEPYTFENFLSKFANLRIFYKSPEVIGRITKEAIEDAAKDNVRYLELRFTPKALSHAEGFPMVDVIDWVIEGDRQGEEEYGVTTRLIVSTNRHEPPEIAMEVVRLALDRLNQGVVGMDLAGNEAEFSAEPFSGFIREAKQEGLHLTIHAGEWGPGNNVLEAIAILNTDRIGHGVRLFEEQRAVDLARERRIPFEVCVTSNLQSGVVESLEEHPIKDMIDEGINVTINTDDPSVSKITLSNEYELLCEELDLSLNTLRERILAGARASFLPDEERQQLIADLTAEFKLMM
jgi:adenosine deaminase